MNKHVSDNDYQDRRKCFRGLILYNFSYFLIMINLYKIHLAQLYLKAFFFFAAISINRPKHPGDIATAKASSRMTRRARVCAILLIYYIITRDIQSSAVRCAVVRETTRRDGLGIGNCRESHPTSDRGNRCWLNFLIAFSSFRLPVHLHANII